MRGVLDDDSERTGESPAEIDPVEGWTAVELREEFPELRLRSVCTPVRRSRGKSADARERLHELANRIRGTQAVHLRQAAVPAAYRVFFRHIGLDPDTTRTPIEAAVLDRMMHGGVASRTLLQDALLIALLETSVPVWALDSERLDGPLGIRLAEPGERLGRDQQAIELAAGRLVVSDVSGVVGVLFGAPVAPYAATAETTSATLYAIAVAGVPDIHVEEALWRCTSFLAG